MRKVVSTDILPCGIIGVAKTTYAVLSLLTASAEPSCGLGRLTQTRLRGCFLFPESLPNMISTIYAVIHKASGKRYIGSTERLLVRWRQHRSDLHENKHHCQHLQRAWNKHGEPAFDFIVIETCPREEQFIREQWYLDNFWDDLYNTARIAGASMAGRKHSEETRAKMTGRKCSEEARIKMSKDRLGRKPSEETRARMSQAQVGKRLGQTRSAESREKMSEAAKRRAPITEETRRKLSEAHLGRKHSEKSLAKMSKIQRGRIVSEETRAKLSRAALGRIISEEQRRKLSEAAKADWTRRKEHHD